MGKRVEKLVGKLRKVLEAENDYSALIKLSAIDMLLEDALLDRVWSTGYGFTVDSKATSFLMDNLGIEPRDA